MATGISLLSCSSPEAPTSPSQKPDPTEMTDLATQEPARLKSMVDKYKAWADHIGVNTSIKFSVGKWYTPVRNYPLEDKND